MGNYFLLNNEIFVVQGAYHFWRSGADAEWRVVTFGWLGSLKRVV
jgi:hypothetical protein